MFILVWDITSIILLFYFLTFLPYFVVFNVESVILTLIEIMIDIFFILDILVNFNLTFINSKGVYEKSRRKIALKYVKGYFALDLLTSIPFGWIFIAFGYESISFNKIFRVLKLPKLYSKIKFSNDFALSNAL